MTNLMTAQEVIDIAIPNHNFKEARINEYSIFVAQNSWIKPAITVDLYDKLIAGSLDTQHTTLLEDYIKPCLAFFVKYEILPDLNLQTTNAGTQMANLHSHNKPSSKDRGEARLAALNHAQTLLDVALAYIKENEEVFTDYEDDENVKNSVLRKAGIIIPTR